MTLRVVGVDWAAKRWACVELTNGAVTTVIGLRTFADVVAHFARVQAIGVDIPIGLPLDGPRRRADLQARSMAGPSTVFATYPQSVYSCPTHAEAVALCRARDWPGISRQSYGLRTHIADVAPFAKLAHEVHPEVTFHYLNGGPLGFSKHTWNGFFIRRNLLRTQGIDVPERIPEALPGVDILDAAAVAWTAQRIAGRRAHTIPADPEAGEPTITY
jgi:predicted RNase H-like nuclease